MKKIIGLYKKYEELKAKLEKENVMVHFPDSYIPEDRTVVIHGKNAAEIEGGHM